MKSIQLDQVIWMAKPTLYLNVRGAVQTVFADITLTLRVTVSTKHFLLHQPPKLSRNPLLKIRQYYQNTLTIKFRKVTFESCLPLVISCFLYPHTMHFYIISHINQFTICIWDYKLYRITFRTSFLPGIQESMQLLLVGVSFVQGH